MKKRILIIVILFACGLAQATAQFWERKFLSDIYVLDEYIKRHDKGINYKNTDSYKGTPYNNPSYLPGNVYKEKELLATNVGLRYNAVADEIEIKESIDSSDNDAKVLTKSPDIYVKILNDIFVFVPYKGGIEGGGYFLVMFEGNKYDLFKKLKKEFIPEKKATTSITRDIPPKFADKSVYYIVTKEGKFYELPSSRKKKLKVFSNNINLIKEYINKNRLDLNKEQDLLRVIRYYDGV